MKCKLFVAGACSAAMLFVPLAVRAASLNKADMQFMKMAATANMTEAHLGQMAEAQASGQNVKDFGKKLSMDHTASYEGLSVLANKVGEQIPKAIGRDRTIARLEHLKGKAFDRTFAQDEVQSHKTVIMEFKNEAEHGENADVKAWAKDMIPTLEGHLKSAEELESQTKTAK